MKNHQFSMIKVMDIRENINYIPDKVGVYEWWFSESDAKKLLKCRTNIDVNRIKKIDFEGEEYWALYFGQAKKESLRKRINWHVNQEHRTSAIKSGTLSTLRQTISALTNLDESTSQDTVNNILDGALIKVIEMQPTEIDDYEKQAIQNGYYPLNIQGNKSVDKEFLKELKSLRKKHKQ